MANKTIKTRIQVKHDTSEHWGNATGFTPLVGEICFYEDVNKFKIGDGVTNIINLPFANAGSDSGRVITVFPEFNMLYDDLTHDYVYQYEASEVKMTNVYGKTANLQMLEGGRCLYLESAESTISSHTIVIS